MVVPAVLPATRKDLDEKLEILSAIPSVRRIQIDVVDGRFASPATWPYSSAGELERMVKQGDMLPHLHRLSYEIDLMCLDAESAADAWLALGASRITLHAESTTNLSRLLLNVRHRHGIEEGTGVVSVGLAVSASTDPALLEPHVSHVNYLQFMGIAKIGRQGQPFERRVLERVKSFRAKYPRLAIQVDGGVSQHTAKDLFAAGVTDVVVGSALLKAADPEKAFDELEKLAHHDKA